MQTIIERHRAESAAVIEHMREGAGVMQGLGRSCGAFAGVLRECIGLCNSYVIGMLDEQNRLEGITSSSP